ncbi:MAG: T9SS type A sorting domain-containing protein [Bacteroidia bacterium]
MKTKTTLFIACLMVTIVIKAQTDTVTVFYPGYTNQCCTANSIPYYCFNDPSTSACGSTASCNTQSFMNTVPAGKVVTKVEVSYYAWNCGGTATPTLNGMTLAATNMTASSCACTSSFVSMITGSSSNTYPCGIPGYNYGVGATETFYVSFSGQVCISQADIILTYTNTPTGTTPTVSIASSNDTICSGATTTLTANGATTYTWNTGATTNSITVSPANTTTYTVIGTDSTGACINMATKAIYVESINIQATQSFICGGPTSVTLTASGANTYTWNTGATTNTIIATPTVTTTYTVTGTGAMTGCTALSAIKTITVSPSPMPITSFTLTQDTAPHTWDATAGYPPNVTGATWYWGDSSSTIGLYPSHIYTTPGSYNICVTVTVTTGCSSAPYCQNDSVYRLANNSVYSTMVYVNVLHPHSQTTSLKQIISNEQVSIYPNPTKDVINLTISQFDNLTIKSIAIYNTIGECVHRQIVGYPLGQSSNSQIDVSSLSEGVYFITIKTTNNTITKKFIVQR